MQTGENNPNNSRNEKDKLRALKKYFSTHQFPHAEKWKFCSRCNHEVRTNMMLERYNGEVKGKFPLGRAPTADIAIYVILLVQEAEAGKRKLYAEDKRKRIERAPTRLRYMRKEELTVKEDDQVFPLDMPRVLNNNSEYFICGKLQQPVNLNGGGQLLREVETSE